MDDENVNMDWDLKTRYDRVMKHREEEEEKNNRWRGDIILFGVFAVAFFIGVAYIFYEHYQLYLLGY